MHVCALMRASCMDMVLTVLLQMIDVVCLELVRWHRLKGQLGHWEQPGHYCMIQTIACLVHTLFYLSLSPPCPLSSNMQVDSRTLAVCLWPPSPLPGVPEPPSVDAICSGSVIILLNDAPGQQAGTATTLASGQPQAAPAAADAEPDPAVAALAAAAYGSKKEQANGTQSETGAAAPAAATGDNASTTLVAEAAVAGAGDAVFAPGSDSFGGPQPLPLPPAAADYADQSAAAMGHATGRQAGICSSRGCFLPQLKLYQDCPPRSLSASDLQYTLRWPKQLGLHCYPAAGEAGVDVSVAVTVPREAAWIASKARAASLRTPGCKAAVVATQAAMAVSGMMSSSRGALQQQGQEQQRQPGHGTTLWLQTIWNQQDCRVQCREGSFSLRHLQACLLPFVDWRLVHCWHVMVGGVGLGYVCHPSLTSMALCRSEAIVTEPCKDG